ncbi:MAG: hypothetical protein J7K68_03250 [Candidatus Diapherotrites archaeon]|nr:hypothetical protein [Candidatus Diapherotrites archaeon]
MKKSTQFVTILTFILLAGCIGQFGVLETQAPVEDAARFIPSGVKVVLYADASKDLPVMITDASSDVTRYGDAKKIFKKIEWFTVASLIPDRSHRLEGMLLIFKLKNISPEEFMELLSELPSNWETKEYKGILLHESEEHNMAYYDVEDKYIIIGDVPTIKESIYAYKENENAVGWVKKRASIVKPADFFIIAERGGNKLIVSAVVKGEKLDMELAISGEAASYMKDAAKNGKFDFEYKISEQDDYTIIKIWDVDVEKAPFVSVDYSISQSSRPPSESGTINQDKYQCSLQGIELVNYNKLPTSLTEAQTVRIKYLGLGGASGITCEGLTGTAKASCKFGKDDEYVVYVRKTAADSIECEITYSSSTNTPPPEPPKTIAAYAVKCASSPDETTVIMVANTSPPGKSITTSTLTTSDPGQVSFVCSDAKIDSGEQTVCHLKSTTFKEGAGAISVYGSDTTSATVTC